MVEQQFRIAEIEVAKSPTDEKIIGIFRYESAGQKKKGASLLILAEISSTVYAYERLLDVINESAEQARHLIAAVETDPVARFEKLIQRINEAVAGFLEGEPTPLSWNRVNLFIMELSQDHICLTGRGRLMNLFLQKQDDGTYRTFDLFGSLEQPAEVDPKKPFAALICGDMKPGDILMAGTLNLERLRNELRIKERLTTMPPVSAALDIKQDLEQHGIPDDFVAAIVACCALEVPSPKQAPAADDVEKSTASIQKLRDAEKDATQHLSPVFSPAATASEQTNERRVMAGFFGLLASLRGTVKRYRSKDIALMASLRGMNAGHGSVFTKKHKRILLAGAAVLLAVAVGAGIWRNNQRLAREEAAWTVTYDQARDNRDRAESDLVYANDTRAKKYIDAAEGLLAGLDTKTPQRNEKIEALKTDLERLKERLRKTQAVEPVELTALAGAPDGALVAPVLAAGVGYAVDNADKTVLKIDTANKTTKRIPLPSGAGTVIAGSLGQKSVVFATSNGAMVAVDLQTDSVTTLSSQPRASSTTDVIVYGGRAYSLDGPNGQVWRAQGTAGGFGSEQPYIKAATTDLAGAVGLAIDSNVYVLKPDATVARFLSGGQEAFGLVAIDPPLRAASAIWTNADATRLAIADPAGKRIVIFNKDGTLKAQLTSKEFTGPRDLDGNEAEKKLLVIDGTRLLLVSLP
ncbi:hypothetical protein HY479_01340 [Candidatus Uhrbacteria bacterium]|nr:hypothetical protein [Candidatus Uhrbacteria bacterium]